MEKRMHRCVVVGAALLAAMATLAGAWALVPLHWRWQLLGVDLRIPVAHQLVADAEAARDLAGLLRSARAQRNRLQREDVPDDWREHAAVNRRIVRAICAWIGGHPRCDAALTAKLIVATGLLFETHGGSQLETRGRLHVNVLGLLDEISQEHPATWQSALARFYRTCSLAQWHSYGEGPSRERLIAGGEALLGLAEENLPPVPSEAFGLLDAWYVRPDFWRKPLRRMMLMAAAVLQLQAVTTTVEGQPWRPDPALLDDAERTYRRFIAEYPDDDFAVSGRSQLQMIAEYLARPAGSVR